MKKLALIVLVAILAAACQQKSQFTLNGEVSPASDGKIVMFGFENGNPVPTDTAVITDGKFTFTGDVEIPELKLLRLEGQKDFISQVFVEPGKINTTIFPDSLDANYTIGSKSHDLFQSYMDEIIHFSSSERQMQNRFRDAQQTGDQEEMEMIMLEYETMLDNTQLFARNIISQNPESPVAAYIYLMNFFQEAEIEELDSIVTLFAPIKESEFVKTIEDRAEKLRVSVVGAQAPDFTLNNADGEQISLSSLQGKYVLIDFWASWCQPCMVELPNLIDLYDQYNDKGFEIFGVSLDRDRNAWVNTVDEKNMVWPNVWDMEGEEPAEAATLYGVTGIPHTVLLDKEGVIIAKNLRGEELKNKLEEILN